MPTKAKSFSVILGRPQPKKYVTRYDADDFSENEVMNSAYINKTQLAELGNPEKVKITVEAAE